MFNELIWGAGGGGARTFIIRASSKLHYLLRQHDTQAAAPKHLYKKQLDSSPAMSKVKS